MTVPNVPCGVERSFCFANFTLPAGVPNVPCGVERIGLSCLALHQDLFLMYRVELKDLILDPLAGTGTTFLMYRVELKGREGCKFWSACGVLFLMYRVELKGHHPLSSTPPTSCVPNVPCGVER